MYNIRKKTNDLIILRKLNDGRTDGPTDGRAGGRADGRTESDFIEMKQWKEIRKLQEFCRCKKLAKDRLHHCAGYLGMY